MFGLSGNHLDGYRRVVFSDMPGAGNARDAVADDNDGSVLGSHTNRNLRAARRDYGSLMEPGASSLCDLESYKKRPKEKNIKANTGETER